MLSISSSSNSKLNQILQTQPRKSNLAFVQLHGNSPTDFRASDRAGLGIKYAGQLNPFRLSLLSPTSRYQYFSAAFCINSNYTHEWGIFIWSDRISGHYAAPSPPTRLASSVHGQQSTSASHLETHIVVYTLHFRGTRVGSHD